MSDDGYTPRHVPDDQEDPSGSSQENSRRNFLKYATAALVVGGGGALAYDRLRSDGGASPTARAGATTTTAADDATSTTLIPAPATSILPPPTVPDGRMMVVLELSGGNDGFSTVVPDDPALRDLRPTIVPDESGLVAFDAGHSLHPALAGLAERGTAVVTGVGSPKPDYSHFEMEARWSRGDMLGDTSSPTGMLGRLCDALGDENPFTGIAFGGHSSAMVSAGGVTSALHTLKPAWILQEDNDFARAMQSGLSAMANESEPMQTAALTEGRHAVQDALEFAELLDQLDAAADTYPSGVLPYELASAATLLSSGLGTKLIHIKMGGFDTHSRQRFYHDGLMADLNASVNAFLDDLDRMGIADRTLVATMSEFGRRPAENEGGTDHGWANSMMLWGPVNPGIHGEPVRLNKLDDDGNAPATVTTDQYYATLVESWFGIPGSEVLLRPAQRLDGLIRS